jgi:sugar (pentulose or hexulose) kinase
LAALAGIDLDNMQLPQVRPAGAELGRIALGGHRLPVYGGLGDLQAAVHGAGFPHQGELIVNLGTGSQVLSAEAAPGVESRPGSTGGSFGAVTHIPSGRMLNVFAQFFDGCATASGGQPFFWQRLSTLTVDEVLAAPDNIDVNVFEAAWHYHDGGAITHIHEGRFSLDSMLASLAHSWLRQYAQAIALLDPQRRTRRFLLAGGLSRRASYIAPVLEALSGRSAIRSASITGEETLDGLLALALGQHAPA